LKTALETYRFSQNKIQDCDKCVERQLAAFETKAPLTDDCTLFITVIDAQD
jgi:hypothetical protein